MRYFLFLSLVLFFACKLDPVGQVPPLQTPRTEIGEIKSDKVLNQIVFGSCNKQYEPQPLWKNIADNNADLWIWLGDNIYGDTENMALMKNRYEQQLNQEAYKQFRETGIDIIGTWDDHDYGDNDAGKEFPKKAESRDLMLEFLSVPENAPIRNREGAYSSYLYGEGDQKVKIILLDARYFRDQPVRQNKTYVPTPGIDILGEAQWKWLEQEIKANEAAIHIIGCGIQMIPMDHAYEKWANFPDSRERLFGLIEDYKLNLPVLLSGDRHIGEVSKMNVGEGFVHEITASGLTHSWSDNQGEVNQYRVGPLVKQLNFGLMEIDWTGENAPKVKVSIRGIDNVVYSEVEF